MEACREAGKKKKKKEGGGGGVGLVRDDEVYLVIIPSCLLENLQR